MSDLASLVHILSPLLLPSSQAPKALYGQSQLSLIYIAPKTAFFQPSSTLTSYNFGQGLVCCHPKAQPLLTDFCVNEQQEQHGQSTRPPVDGSKYYDVSFVGRKKSIYFIKHV